ncbi:unnamed protein product [Amoebophrya sp. A120]|nr:unnamed protein product [Amoebophrya sp. A120]|eukprot:GSA120T00019894001.1
MYCGTTSSMGTPGGRHTTAIAAVVETRTVRIPAKRYPGNNFAKGKVASCLRGTSTRTSGRMFFSIFCAPRVLRRGCRKNYVVSSYPLKLLAPLSFLGKNLITGETDQGSSFVVLAVQTDSMRNVMDTTSPTDTIKNTDQPEHNSDGGFELGCFACDGTPLEANKCEDSSPDEKQWGFLLEDPADDPSPPVSSVLQKDTLAPRSAKQAEAFGQGTGGGCCGGDGGSEGAPNYTRTAKSQNAQEPPAGNDPRHPAPQERLQERPPSKLASSAPVQRLGGGGPFPVLPPGGATGAASAGAGHQGAGPPAATSTTPRSQKPGGGGADQQSAAAQHGALQSVDHDLSTVPQKAGSAAPHPKKASPPPAAPADASADAANAAAGAGQEPPAGSSTSTTLPSAPLQHGAAGAGARQSANLLSSPPSGDSALRGDPEDAPKASLTPPPAPAGTSDAGGAPSPGKGTKAKGKVVAAKHVPFASGPEEVIDIPGRDRPRPREEDQQAQAPAPSEDHDDSQLVGQQPAANTVTGNTHPAAAWWLTAGGPQPPPVHPAEGALAAEAGAGSERGDRRSPVTTPLKPATEEEQKSPFPQSAPQRGSAATSSSKPGGDAQHQPPGSSEIGRHLQQPEPSAKPDEQSADTPPKQILVMRTSNRFSKDEIEMADGKKRLDFDPPLRPGVEESAKRIGETLNEHVKAELRKEMNDPSFKQDESMWRESIFKKVVFLCSPLLRSMQTLDALLEGMGVFSDDNGGRDGVPRIVPQIFLVPELREIKAERFQKCDGGVWKIKTPGGEPVCESGKAKTHSNEEAVWGEENKGTVSSDWDRSSHHKNIRFLNDFFMSGNLDAAFYDAQAGREKWNEVHASWNSNDGVKFGPRGSEKLAGKTSHDFFVQKLELGISSQTKDTNRRTYTIPGNPVFDYRLRDKIVVVVTHAGVLDANFFLHDASLPLPPDQVSSAESIDPNVDSPALETLFQVEKSIPKRTWLKLSRSIWLLTPSPEWNTAKMKYDKMNGGCCMLAKNGNCRSAYYLEYEMGQNQDDRWHCQHARAISLPPEAAEAHPV